MGDFIGGQCDMIISKYLLTSPVIYILFYDTLKSAYLNKVFAIEIYAVIWSRQSTQ